MRTVFVFNNDQMGHGDEELGQKILRSCVRKASLCKDLDAVVFYNSGVRLMVKDSHAAAEMDILREKGVELLVCQTCVEHYGLGDQVAVDRVSNMDEILKALFAAEKVVTI